MRFAAGASCAIVTAFISSAVVGVYGAPYVYGRVPPPPRLSARKRSQIRVEAQMTGGILMDDALAFAEQRYDYIIVGGGTAGLALAARLSEDGTSLVGVLEAGDVAVDDPNIDVPGLFGKGLNGKWDWNFTAEGGNGVPQMAWPRGKVLGGSSALNFLVWDRSSRTELDALEDLGNPGWNWGNLIAAVRKAEDFTMPDHGIIKQLDIHPNPTELGTGGPVKVSYPQYIGEAVRRWTAAFKSLGISQNDHSLSGDNIGVAQQPSDINPKNNSRSYSAASYIYPLGSRWNLKILLNAMVTKIDMKVKPNGPRDSERVMAATGVRFIHNGRTYGADASSEVILCAGTIGTPKLLELSGIGSRSRLQKLGIETLINLPNVGENLQDHTYVPMVYRLREGVISRDALYNNITFRLNEEESYRAGEPSILDASVTSVAYVPLSAILDKAAVSSLVEKAANYVRQCEKPYKTTLEKQVNWLRWNNAVAQMEFVGINGFYGPGIPDKSSNYFTVWAASQHLLSRGSVHLRSANVFDNPIIIPNYFDAPFDYDVALAGAEFVRKIVQAAPYANILAEEAVPGDTMNLNDYVKKYVHTEFHPIGTASMLPKDKGGVVSHCLRVYGTSNLRIVDASILPIHLAAHIQATVYGIAEYAAMIIRNKTQYCS